MKYIKSFKESLEDNFKQTTSSMTDPISSEYRAEKLRDLLPDNLKKEFMYRLSDGENFIDLIQEFVDRTELSPQDDEQFRIVVMADKMKKLKEQYKSHTYGMSLIKLAFEKGTDYIFDNLIKRLITDGVESDQMKTILEDTLVYLEKIQELTKWTYKRNPYIELEKKNDEGISVCKELINKISEHGTEFSK